MNSPKKIDLLRSSMIKCLVLFRMRVNGTKLPYLWLFLPVLLRVAPYALLVLTLSNNEMGLRFIQITLMTAPCSILLRRIFRIKALHQRLPEWLNKGYGVTHTLYSFALLTFLESIFPITLVSLGVLFSTGGNFLVAFRFLLISLMLLVLGIAVVVLLCPSILVAYQKYEDVRHGARYSFMILSVMLMLCITLNWSSSTLLSILPIMFFVNLTAIPYEDFRLITLLLSLISLLVVVLVLLAKFPMAKIAEIQEVAEKETENHL